VRKSNGSTSQEQKAAGSNSRACAVGKANAISTVPEVLGIDLPAGCTVEKYWTANR